jgi:hypothetical protein
MHKQFEQAEDSTQNGDKNVEVFVVKTQTIYDGCRE